MTTNARSNRRGQKKPPMVGLSIPILAMLATFFLSSWGTAQTIDPPQEDATREETTEQRSSLELSIVAPAIIALLGVIFVQIVTFQRSTRNLRSTISKERNLEEIKQIDLLLNDFFGKLTLVLGRDHIFAQHLRVTRPDDYRLLISLFKEGWLEGLSASERALVHQVCTAAQELDQLITDHLGELEPSIIEYFVQASAHFRVLHLAYKGDLGDDQELWAKFVYPKGFDAVVHEKMRQLRQRRTKLVREIDGEHPPMEELSLGTGEYYKLDEVPDSDGRYTRLLFGVATWEAKEETFNLQSSDS